MTSKYTAPLPVGQWQVVRLRSVKVADLPGMRVMGYRLTHPHGRTNLAPKDFVIRETALAYARDRGWRVVGG